MHFITLSQNANCDIQSSKVCILSHYLRMLTVIYNLPRYAFYHIISECIDDIQSPVGRGGAEVAGWTFDRKIRVRFPAYPHRVWAVWWQGGKRCLRTSRCPRRGRLGTPKTPSCPWRGCPAAGQNLETGHLSCHYIAEILLNVTLNHNQQQHIQSPKVCISSYYLRMLMVVYKPHVQYSKVHVHL